MREPLWNYRTFSRGMIVAYTVFIALRFIAVGSTQPEPQRRLFTPAYAEDAYDADGELLPSHGNRMALLLNLDLVLAN